MGTIKQLTKADLTTLRDLSIRTYSDTFAQYNDPQDLEDYLATAYNTEKLTLEMANSETEFYFIYVDDQLAGYVKINIGTAQTEPVNENGLEIERIYVERDFKGQGLGKQLYAKALERAKQLGKTSIWLGVWEHNAPALQFYKGLGFTRVGEHSFFMGKDEQLDFLMEVPI
ncbi:GNAT family N-acetyltransferase [Enterococcus sp. LJL99]